MTSKRDIWSRRIEGWLRPPRRLSFTPAGKYFVLMTLGVGFGAINTGNNLLFLMLGMMLSLIVASGVLSEAVLREMRAQRMPPRQIFARQSSPAHLELINPKRFPSLSVEVAERNPRCVSGPLRGQLVGPQRVPWWKFWKRGLLLKTAFPQGVAMAYCLRIDGGASLALGTAYHLPKRGLYEFPGLSVSTRFPFGFFEKSREIDDAATLVAYPPAAEAEDWVASVHAHFGDVSRNVRGAGEEFFGLREYRAGEDRRMVHWKSSARRGELVVKETESQEQRAIEICLLNCTGTSAQKRHLVVANFEAGLEKTAGLLHAMARQGYQIGLRTIDDAIEAASGAMHMDRLLYILATIELKDGVHAPLARAAEQRGPTVGRVVVGLSGALDASGADGELLFAFDDVAGER
ncbi:MAG: DUF58 domain-containing protein [Bradymonadaceae bacterium]|nr:DUF58 domain-containing protein [Lujinxingiaceae bacterium]